MTTDTYRNFIAIVECGNILAASQKLMVAQPALSNQLKNLEKNMGTRLLNRGSRAVTLTAAGEIFYQKAKIIVSMEDSAKKRNQRLYKRPYWNSQHIPSPKQS